MNTKQLIIDSIEKEKQQKIKEYDNRINQVLNETNQANVYYSLAETFYNTMAQGEIGIKYLQTILTNDFFKSPDTNVENGVNYIIFSNEEFEVSFSKSLSREIRIKYKNTGSRPSHYESVTPSAIRLADLIEIYLNHKTFKNFKELADYNCRKRKKTFINKIAGYIGTYKRCNEELFVKIRERQENDRVRKEEYEKQLEEFNKKQQYAKDFIDNLTDLNMFTEAGWYISKYGIVDENGRIRY